MNSQGIRQVIGKSETDQYDHKDNYNSKKIKGDNEMIAKQFQEPAKADKVPYPVLKFRSSEKRDGMLLNTVKLETNRPLFKIAPSMQNKKKVFQNDYTDSSTYHSVQYLDKQMGSRSYQRLKSGDNIYKLPQNLNLRSLALKRLQTTQSTSLSKSIENLKINALEQMEKTSKGCGFGQAAIFESSRRTIQLMNVNNSKSALKKLYSVTKMQYAQLNESGTEQKNLNQLLIKVYRKQFDKTKITNEQSINADLDGLRTKIDSQNEQISMLRDQQNFTHDNIKLKSVELEKSTASNYELERKTKTEKLNEIQSRFSNQANIFIKKPPTSDQQQKRTVFGQNSRQINVIRNLITAKGSRMNNNCVFVPHNLGKNEGNHELNTMKVTSQAFFSNMTVPGFAQNFDSQNVSAKSLEVNEASKSKFTPKNQQDGSKIIYDYKNLNKVVTFRPEKTEKRLFQHEESQN